MLIQIAPVALTVRRKNFTSVTQPARFAARQRPEGKPNAMTRPVLPAFQRARLRAKVAAVTCSEPWTELAVARAEASGIDPNIANMAGQLADRGIYPPKADAGRDGRPRCGAVRMRRCDGCGRIVPPINVASHRLVRRCDDCRMEPDVDPDEKADRVDFARAPGAQLGVLVEGAVDGNADRREAREQLHRIGLTSAEITAMAMTHAGFSTRAVADMGRWSQTYLRKLVKSAARKLCRSGLVVPQASTAATLRPCTVDPTKLDCMSDRVR